MTGKTDSGNYVVRATRTEPEDYEPIIQRLADLKAVRMLHCLMGLTTEIGELMEVLKRHVFYGEEIDWVNVKEEFGDLNWYQAIGLSVMDEALDDVLGANIGKLLERYPERFTEERALNRDLDAEREALEK